MIKEENMCRYCDNSIEDPSIIAENVPLGGFRDKVFRFCCAVNGDGYIHISVNANYVDFMEFPPVKIKYCPMCGRKL